MPRLDNEAIMPQAISRTQNFSVPHFYPTFVAMKRLICFVLLLAASCGRSPLPPDVAEQQPRSETPVDEATYTKIFLAGTIDMGNSVDWQAATVRRVREMAAGRYLFFNPRRAAGLDGTTEDLHYQIRWELEHLERADLILMHILSGSKSPVTLLEMGLHLRSGKLRVACEPGFYRYDNVKITCEQYGVPLYASLDEMLADVFGM